jgi:FK506-binding nuclear protein
MELNTTFYGTIVKPGRKIVFEPNKERSNKLHLSQAVLGSRAVKGERVVLKCRRADEGQDDIYLCSLRSGHQESCLLDLMFDEYVEFSIDGDTAVHLTGYTITYEEDESSYDSELEEELDNAVRMIRDQPESDDDDSASDSYDSYDDSDMIEIMTDDDDSESDDESDDSELLDSDNKAEMKKGSEPDYIIEEIVEDKGKKEKNGASTSGSSQRGNNNSNNNKSPSKKQSKRSASDALNESTPPKKRDKSSAASAKKEAKEKGDGNNKASASSSKGKKQQEKDNAGSTSGGNNQGQSIQRFSSGLEVINTAMGKAGGKLATNGKRIYVKYVGRLKKTGQVFDKSKKPFCFRLGVGEVISGWDVGVKGMRVGDKRRITVPPSMGYGAKRTGPIPANSTLVFDVELVDVR